MVFPLRLAQRGGGDTAAFAQSPCPGPAPAPSQRWKEAGGRDPLRQSGLALGHLSPVTAADSEQFNKQQFFIAQHVGRGKQTRGQAEGGNERVGDPPTPNQVLRLIEDVSGDKGSWDLNPEL